jgi:hypothetical protein
MRRRALILLCCAAVAACSGAAAPPATVPAAVEMPTPATATSPPSPPPPSPTPEPVPEPVPIDVIVDRLDTERLDGAALRGEPQRPLDEAVVQRAAGEVRAALAAYLNAQLAASATRFGPTGLEALLTPGTVAALTAEQRRALGELDAVTEQVETSPARAELLVVLDGPDVASVAVTYVAAVTLLGPDGPAPLRQRGTLLFTTGGPPWQADVVDVRLDLGQDLEDGA